MTSAGASQADDGGQTFLWSPGDGYGGSWSVASDWLVGASETPAGTVPGPEDSVFINTMPRSMVGTFVEGTGYSHDLTIGSYVDLEGIFYTQTFDVEHSDPLKDVSHIAGGGSVEATTASILGSFDVSGSLQVSGLLDQQGDDEGGSIFVENGGALQAGALEIDDLGLVAVDGTSSADVGASSTTRAGYLSIGPGAVLEMTGQSGIEAKIWNDGTIKIDPSQGSGFHGVASIVSITVAPGFLSGSGSIQIDAGSSLALVGRSDPDVPSGPVDVAQALRFAGPNSTLRIGDDDTDLFSIGLDDVVGFDTSDRIVLDQEVTSHGFGYTIDENRDAILRVSVTGPDGQTADDVITLVGQYAGAQFQIFPGTNDDDGQPDLVITETVACFCPGTLIAVPDGAVPVETLRIGDRVVTAAGSARPVLWIGRRSYARHHAAGRADLQPVRIRAGALGGGLPRRDLLVSPKHAVLVRDVLVPAGLLANGVSVLHDEQPGDVHYLHVELADHDLLLAEGAAAESFVDDDSRAMFHNVDEYRRLYPDRAIVPPAWCRPRVEDGPALIEARRHIDRIAGLPDGPALPPVHGHLDEAAAGRLRGWAWCPAAPDAPVLLEVLVDGAARGHVLADRHRGDLVAAGIGSGCHGFELLLAHVRADAVLSVCRAADRAVLAGLPAAA